MSVSNIVHSVTLTAGEAVPIYRFVEIQSDGKADRATPGYVGGTSSVFTLTSNATPATAGTFALYFNGHIQVYAFDAAASLIQSSFRAIFAAEWGADAITCVATTGVDLGDASAVVTCTFIPQMGLVETQFDGSGLTGNQHVPADPTPGVDPALTGLIHGVSCDSAAADGDPLTVSLPIGINKIEAGAAVTRGSQITTDSVGRVVDHVSGAGNTIAGVALESASAAGEIIRVFNLITQDGLTPTP